MLTASYHQIVAYVLREGAHASLVQGHWPSLISRARRNIRDKGDAFQGIPVHHVTVGDRLPPKVLEDLFRNNPVSHHKEAV